MMLCLDIGNSQVFGGVFADDQIKLRFRRTSRSGTSSDEFGLFLRSVLRENDLNVDGIRQIAICTVVPEALHSIKNACLKYFKINPFVLQAGVKTGLKIRYKNPVEVGSDRIANAIAATHENPNQDLILVDFGTATTFCAVNSKKEYLGGVITAGLRLSMESLEMRTSRLPAVEILPRKECLSKTTVESIQSGLYWGTIGQVKEITERLVNEGFEGQRPKIIGTGGFASLFSKADLFDEENPDLVLKGLNLALRLNA